jgi:regulator of sirC expression with transglutaminase-like and TPR domain
MFKEAIQAATNGLKISPLHVNSLHARGYALIQTGEYERAQKDLKQGHEVTDDPKKRQQFGHLLETVRVRQASRAVTRS